MKDYIQVSESVFRKAELRIAENKRRSTVIKRNTIAASGAAAVLFAGMWQNEGFRNAVTSIPELASKGWSHSSETSSTATTTLPEITTVTETSSTTTTTSTTERTTSETTTTTETTTAAETTTEPVVTTLPLMERLPHVNVGNSGLQVVEATDEMLEFENGMKVNVAEGEVKYVGVFHVGDVIQFDADFAYDDENDIYYYNRFSFHLVEAKRNSYYEQPADSEPREEPVYNEEDYPINELGERETYLPWIFEREADPALDYGFLKESKNFRMLPNQDYKIHVTGLKIKYIRDYWMYTEDDREWEMREGCVYGLTPEEFANLSDGDTVDFTAYVIADEKWYTFSIYQMRFEKVVKANETENTESE